MRQPSGTHRRVVLTGGPGGGKTTAADLFRREIGDGVVVVPEAATILFRGGFPRVPDPDAQCASQRAIFEVQSSLEDVHEHLYADRTLLCDRGTVDGAAYWPAERGGAAGFFEAFGTTHLAQLARYDVVLFFETAAAGGVPVASTGRTESVDEARRLDRRLHECWSAHPRFHFVPHRRSFLAKITEALELLEAVITEPDGVLADGMVDGLTADGG